MKDRENPEDPGAEPSLDQLEGLLPSALRERALGIPETELEVAAFEAELGAALNAPLPAGLRAPAFLEAPAGVQPESPRATAAFAQPEARSSEPRIVAPARLGRGAALVALVALAASVSFWLGKRSSLESSTTSALGAAASAGPERARALRTEGAPVEVEFDSSCDAKSGAARCCSGAACATSGGKACPSGRSCVRCELSDPGLERFRVRFGELWLSARGEELLAGHRRRAEPGPRGALSLCLSVGRAGRKACRPASGGAASPSGQARVAAAEEPDAFLVSSAELLSGFSVEVVSNDDGARLGAWSTPVQITPSVLCIGVLAKPVGDGGTAIGAASFFFDDAEYVEVAGAASVAEGERAAANLRVRGAELKLFETTRPDPERFALALGPLSFADAQRLRWQLLKAGSGARVSQGEEFVEPGRVLFSE